jgi:hypothetical protein
MHLIGGLTLDGKYILDINTFSKRDLKISNDEVGGSSKGLYIISIPLARPLV